jgi:hypothetical protein
MAVSVSGRTRERADRGGAVPERGREVREEA